MFPVVLHFVPPNPPIPTTPTPPPPKNAPPPQKQIRKCCVRFYWLEQSKSRRATLRRPRHCVWRCCGDANVTRCCPLSHVTSVMDVEWFWSGGVKEREGGEEVRRKKSITKSVALTVSRAVGKRCSMHKQEVLGCSRVSERREKISD